MISWLRSPIAAGDTLLTGASPASSARLKVRHWELTSSTPNSSGTSSGSSGVGSSSESGRGRLSPTPRRRPARSSDADCARSYGGSRSAVRRTRLGVLGLCQCRAEQVDLCCPEGLSGEVGRVVTERKPASPGIPRSPCNPAQKASLAWSPSPAAHLWATRWRNNVAPVMLSASGHAVWRVPSAAGTSVRGGPTRLA